MSPQPMLRLKLIEHFLEDAPRGERVARDEVIAPPNPVLGHASFTIRTSLSESCQGVRLIVLNVEQAVQPGDGKNFVDLRTYIREASACRRGPSSSCPT